MEYFKCTEEESIPVYFKYIKSEKERITKEIDSELKDYRDMSLKQKNKQITKRIHELEISKKIEEVKLTDYLVSSDYTSLYPLAEADSQSIWPKIKLPTLSKTI